MRAPLVAIPALGLPLAAIIAVGAIALGGCGSKEPSEESASGKLQVVAAENFWGSIAAQVGGEKVQVRSIVVNPNADPHSYEPSAEDARAMAGAQVAIVNGIGYDEWASRLLAASPSSERAVLDVGKVLALGQGANPHQWYSPAHVRAVVGAIVAAFDRKTPARASYFAQQRRVFEDVGLARYDELIRRIRARYAGVAVGYSESIFQPLGEALGLKLLTPYGFARAIAEGGEVSARDKQVVDRQVSSGQVKVWVVNVQNLTPDVQRVSAEANTAHVPIATLTETLSPAKDTFEQWQVAQLEGLERALHAATGR
ncbi:MAG TPA: zinc ABC transporter substrate-binding protein [Solirubrobacteraceae bacterium]|nr:zinc ABC transporter substrate-binding protein [Solirubrobacteraceae bacterium]